MTGRLDIDPDHLAQVQDILRSHLPKGVEVLVFGSRARGGAKRFSDLDLALNGPQVQQPALMSALAWAFEDSDLPWKVDVVDLQTLSPSFRAAIEAELVRLVVDGAGR